MRTSKVAVRQRQTLLRACLTVRNGAGSGLSAIGDFKRETDILRMSDRGRNDHFLTFETTAARLSERAVQAVVANVHLAGPLRVRAR